MSDPKQWWEQDVAAVEPGPTAAIDPAMPTASPPAQAPNWWETDAAAPAAAAPPDAKGKKPATWGETAVDVAKATPTGILKGILGVGSMPGNFELLYRMGLDWGAQKLGYADPRLSQPKPADDPVYGGRATFLPSYSDYKADLEKRIGTKLYEPTTTAGEYAQTGGEFATGGFMGPTRSVGRRVADVAAPAVASETAGQMTKGTEYEPWARVGGAFTGAVAPSLLSRAVTPMPIRANDPEHLRAIQALDKEGVSMTAGQRTNRMPLRWMESASNDVPLGGQGGQKAMVEQGETYTRAALKRIGENERRATDTVMDKAFDRIGGNFDRLAAGNTLRADMPLANDLRSSVSEYFSLVPESHRAPIIKNTIADISKHFGSGGPGTGTLSGEAYQALRSRLDKAGRATKVSDPQLSDALFGIREALDGAMERSISPAQAKEWAKARREYRNILVIEKAVGGPGEQGAKGIITPARLGAAVDAQNRRSYVRGKGDFAELARAGKAALLPLPQSGTAPRAAAMGALNTLAGVGGYGAGGPLGAAAALAAPAASARLFMSSPVQRYLGNQVMTPMQPYLRSPAFQSQIPGVTAGAFEEQ
jgi:hypothetical protein